MAAISDSLHPSGTYALDGCRDLRVPETGLYFASMFIGVAGFEHLERDLTPVMTALAEGLGPMAGIPGVPRYA